MSKEYNAFRMLYIKYAMMKHSGNPEWDTEEKTVENLGGENGLNTVYLCWAMCSEESQRRALGFSFSDVKQHLEKAGL